MESIICKNVGKKYKEKVVLQDVNLELEHGKIYGLIGRNGAGKTTLLSMITAQNPVSEGAVLLGDTPVWENGDILGHMCFSRELNPQTNAMKVKEYLKIAAMYYPKWDQNYADQLIADFELDVKQSIVKLSKGMVSMVSIIVALASKAEYTFLDEPVAGLDVVARDFFYRKLIEEYTETGRTFVISTHIIDEASDVFEEVIVVNNHTIMMKENTQELLDRAYHLSGPAELIDQVTQELECYHAEKMGRSKGVTVLLGEGQKLPMNSDISVQQVTLQNLFVALCGKDM